MTLFIANDAFMNMNKPVLLILSSLAVFGCDNAIEEYDPERPAMVIGQDAAPVRQQPGRHSMLNTRLKPGTRIKVMAKFCTEEGQPGNRTMQTWYRIRIDASSTGWCHGRHIKIDR